SVATTLSATSVPVGGAIHDSSAFTGAVTPTGTVTYSIFNESTCTTPATAAQISGQPAAVTVNANGTIPDSANVTFNAAGTYYWQAVYGGDVNNNAVNPNGTIPNSASVTFNKAGTYYWQASYGGDGNNVAVKSPCTSETITIGKASPPVATPLPSTSLSRAGAIHDSSAFTGAVTPT